MISIWNKNNNNQQREHKENTKKYWSYINDQHFIISLNKVKIKQYKSNTYISYNLWLENMSRQNDHYG